MKAKKHSPPPGKNVATRAEAPEPLDSQLKRNFSWSGFKALLALPVSGASLAVFRIGVGLVMALEAYSLCKPNTSAIAAGTSPLQTYYTGADITFNFPYGGFEWVPLLPPKFIYAIVGLQALSALMMAAGAFYRIAAPLVFLTWGYLFVVESTRTYWQSHYYLELLVTFLMIWMPAARCYSVDAWLANRTNARTAVKTIPEWPIIVLRAQLMIAYFYAGVAKLTQDWLLDAVPVRWFLREAHVAAPYERFLSAAQFEAFKTFLQSPGLAYFLSYTGVLFDLAVGFLLLFRRTRPFALGCMIIFHAMNHFLIFDDIGWFPLLGIATALIFLDPDWPERFWRWIRKPSLPRFDKHWLIGGAIAFPFVGALLGIRPGPPAVTAKAPEQFRLGSWVLPFVVAWISLQAVIPLRHFFIPGDGRFTYEGMSFSWRLKSEMRNAWSHQLFVKDPAILSTEATGATRIDWNQWHGDKVIYREIAPGKIDWQALPEIVVILEPLAGERIIYNPRAAGVETEAEARDRLRQIWQNVYGRAPVFVGRPAALPQVLETAATALQNGGEVAEAAKINSLVSEARKLSDPSLSSVETLRIQGAVRDALDRIKSRDASGQLAALTRSLPPFLLGGEGHSTRPFLIVEDKPLFTEGPDLRIARNLWRASESTRPRQSRIQSVGAEPLLVYLQSPGPEAREALPQWSIWDSQVDSERPPYIWWNSLRDLSISKLLHSSNQAFYLRRYARRVAAVWEKEYGRRPQINAFTSMSLNGRPYQALVDPAADLASVSSRWLSHNPWINDLPPSRIPRTALERNWQGSISGVNTQ